MRIRTTLLVVAMVTGVVAGSASATATAAPKPPTDAGTPVVHLAPSAPKTRAAGSGSAGGDFTGDGRPDILARSASDGRLYVYKHSGAFNGTSTYSTVYVVDAGWSGMTWIGAADMNGDGLADVVSTDAAGVMRIAVNDRAHAPRLVPNQVVNFGWTINDKVVVADYNGDGYDDLLATRVDSYEVYVYLNNGGVTGLTTFAAPQLAISGFWGFESMYFADFTKDGMLDMAYTSPLGILYLYDPRVNAVYRLGSGFIYRDQVSVTDLNGDGRPDLVYRDPSLGYLYGSVHKGTWDPGTNGDAGNTLAPEVLIGTGWNMHNIIT